jgi:hypothetical protein
MNAQDDSTAPSRTGMRRIIPLFEFRRLGAMARVRIAVGTVGVGLAVITLVGGSFTAKAFAWAAFFLVLGALQFLVGYWRNLILVLEATLNGPTAGSQRPAWKRPRRSSWADVSGRRPPPIVRPEPASTQGYQRLGRSVTLHRPEQDRRMRWWADNRIDIILDGGEKSSLWWATKNEWLGLLEVAGLELEALYGGFAGEPFDDNSREYVFVARR